MPVRAQQSGHLVLESLCHVEPAVPGHQAQGPKHLLLKLAAEAAAVAVSPNPQPCDVHSRMAHSLATVATVLSSQAEDIRDTTFSYLGTSGMDGSLPWFSDLERTTAQALQSKSIAGSKSIELIGDVYLTLGKLTGAGATTRPRLTMPFLLQQETQSQEQLPWSELFPRHSHC